MGPEVRQGLGNRGGKGKVHGWLAPLMALQAARGRLFPWAPVFMGIGVGLWFALPFEPGLPHYALALATVLGAIAWQLWGPEIVAPLIIAAGCLALGVLSVGLRAHLVKAPVLDFRYYGPVEGRIVGIDRSQGDHLRITLDRVVLYRMDPDDTPRTVRVSLHGDQADLRAEPGITVGLTAHLTAPPGPAEPGAFDFRRMAFFQSLGAVGYATAPALALAPSEPGTQLINRLRARLSAIVQARIPGQAGAFASGSVTGDRSGITQDTVEDLRDSNLSHLLAISGMNMAFLVAFVFGLFRYGLALVPWVALRVNTKKVAALVSLGVAAFYLALSGSNVATERAFVMVSVMLIAVLADRRGLTMRSVAIAGIVLLLLKPESLLSPGFQMSFAATIGLIAAFRSLDQQIVREKVPRWMMPVFAIVLSSLVGGLSTAPLAAGHFNRFTDYGLLANLLTAPSMGMLVMPGAVMATLLAPVGLEGIGFLMLHLGSAWILGVAHWVAGLDGAVTGIPAPGKLVLPMMALGALWVVLWQGRVRALGAVPIVLALALWTFSSSRPPVLISGDGVLVGLMGPEGRVLSAPKGARFVASSWLEDDGDLADQESAAARAGFDGPPGERRFRLGALSAVQVKGKGAEDRLAAACASADLVILAARALDVPPGCTVIDADMLRGTGTLAIWPEGDGLRLVATDAARRLWTGPGPERAVTDRLAALAAQ
jgi:competence protein ComEC